MRKILYSLLIVTVSSLHAGWQEVQSMLEGDGDGSLMLGYSVAMDGNYAVVGAPMENNERGAVYVFHRTYNAPWQFLQKFEGDDLTFGTVWSGVDLGHTGASVDVVSTGGAGAAMIVGAPYSTIHYTENQNGVYVAQTEPGSVNIIYELNATSGMFEYAFLDVVPSHNATGNSVSIGFKISEWDNPPTYVTQFFAVAGYPEDNLVKTFLHIEGEDFFTINTEKNDGVKFGKSVAVDRYAGYLIVGDPDSNTSSYNSEDGGTTVYQHRGEAIVYRAGEVYRDENGTHFSWRDPQSVKQPIPAFLTSDMQINENTHFGRSVDIMGNRAVIGAERENISYCLFKPCDIDGGEAIVLSLEDEASNRWGIETTLKGSGVAGGDDDFAYRVSLYAIAPAPEVDRIAVSAPTYNGTGTDTVGAVFMYDSNGTAWHQNTRIIGRGLGYFGSGISIDRDEIMIGNGGQDAIHWYQYKENNINPAVIMYLLQ